MYHKDIAWHIIPIFLVQTCGHGKRKNSPSLRCSSRGKSIKILYEGYDDFYLHFTETYGGIQPCVCTLNERLAGSTLLAVLLQHSNLALAGALLLAPFREAVSTRPGPILKFVNNAIKGAIRMQIGV